MSRLDLARERITDMENPCFGWDMGEVWAAIKDDLDHPAWRVVSWDAQRYLSLVRGLHIVHGPQISYEEYHALSEIEQEVIDSREETVTRVGREIAAEVIDDFDIYLYTGIDEADCVERAVSAGLHAAYVLAQELMPESIEA